MADKPIEQMTFEELKKEVQILSDSLSRLKRTYEDAFYNLDDDNFSKTIVKEKNGMKAQIKINEREIATKVSDGEMESAILQSAGNILLTVGASYETKSDAAAKLTTARSEIQQSANSILLSVSETYETKSDASSSYNSLISQTATAITTTVTKQYITNKIDGEYVSTSIAGLDISVDNNNKGYVKVYTKTNDVITSSAIFNKDGLNFYDRDGDKEGWAIEPDSDVGGLLKYYVNDVHAASFGREALYTDLVLKAQHGNVGRFVVDLTYAGYPEIKFVGLNATDNGNSPYIYANEKLLATQNWVSNNAVIYARFG